MKTRPVVAIAASLPLIASILAAQSGDLGAQTGDDEPADEIVVNEEMTVSANRFEVPISEVGSSVTVIGLDEIEQRNQIYVQDLLRTIPGVELTQGGGPGKVSGIRIRGGSSAQALILIDGVRVNSVTLGQFSFANLMADNVERIEVLRGPQATYGSEAMSGVVSITTRRGEPGWRLRATAEAGGSDHQRFALGLAGAHNAFDYSFSVSDLSTDAVSHVSVPGGAIEDDPYDNQSYSARLGVAFLEDGRVDLSIRSSEGDTALDGFGVEDLNRDAVTDDESFVLTVEKNFTPSWRQTLRVGSSETHLVGTDPDSFFSNYDIRSEILQIEAQADITLNESNLLNIGYSVEDRDAMNIGTFTESVDFESWFVQDQYSPTDNVHLTAAIRRDDHSVFGSETTYRATGAASFSGGRTRLHGSVGSAFRAPSFNELFFPFFGNLSLVPETSDGFDLGMHHHLEGNRWSFDLTYFDIDFENLIGYDFVLFLANNIAEASSNGVELTVGYRRGTAFDLDFSHTYNDTEDKTTGLPLPRRPKQRTTLVARFAPTDALDGAVIFTSVRDRIDSSGLDIDDYERVDLSVRYAALPWLQPFVRIENALDEDYEEVPGFTTPGRVFFAGVTLTRK